MMRALHLAAGLGGEGLAIAASGGIELPVAAAVTSEVLAGEHPLPVEPGVTPGVRLTGQARAATSLSAPALGLEQPITLLPAAVASIAPSSLAAPGLAAAARGLRLWEWLVLLAFALALVDAALHLKGRIP